MGTYGQTVCGKTYSPSEVETVIQITFGTTMPPSRENELLLMLVPLYVVMLSTLLLFSCGAAKSAQEITLKVPDHFAGVVKISPCDRNAGPPPIAVDTQGMGSTSECPQGGRQVSLIVVRADQTYRISPEHVKIRRTGDGLPVSIEASLPVR